MIPVDQWKPVNADVELFSSRQKSDYSDFVTFKAEDVAGWLKPTEEFVAHIDRLIQTIK